VDNLSTAFGLAAQGLAATLAPAYTRVMAAGLGLEMRRIVEPASVRRVSLYRASGRSLSPAAEAFAEHLLRFLPRWAKP